MAFIRGLGPRSSGFTLIELLIVIAIVAVLSVVVIATLNPGQLLKQSRDSNRMADLATLNRALTLYLGDQIGGSLGNASTTYFSLIDTTATSSAGTNCSGVGLTPPTGWAYHCAASSTYKRVDGTGWIPVNFRSMSIGSGLGSLPVDFTNTSSTGLYYSYTPGAFAYAVAAGLESDRYLASKAGGDGGYDPGKYEVGSDLSLEASSEGLVGWWPFDEASGNTAQDASGKGNNGTLSASAPSRIAGKVGGALQFGGFSSGNNVSVGNDASLNPSRFTLMAWVSPGIVSSTYNYILSNARDCCGTYNGIEFRLYQNKLGASIWNSSLASILSNGNIADNSGWQFVAVTYDGANLRTYMNGALDKAFATTLGVGSPSTYGTYIGAMAHGPTTYVISGSLDEVRMYNRSLSDAEIAAIYNSQR